MNLSDLTSINELSPDAVAEVLDLALRLKKEQKAGKEHPILKGKTLAMVFEKPSLRTRVTFEVGMQQMGGYALYLGPSDIQLGVRESVADVARNLSRWVDGIMARTFSHKTVADLAEYAEVPVINGLSDLEHPCQALADFLTIHERKGDLRGITLAYIGDGNNVANSLMLLAARVGTSFVVACPSGYEPDQSLWQSAKVTGETTGSRLLRVEDPREAVREADVIYTDVWVSMGQEEETDRRTRDFQPYQVNSELLRHAKPDAIVMHCLPAHRGLEITDDVLDGPQSVVLDQAENRLHAQKAVMGLLMG
ncbi:MAG: ornithine carbamoyltransferase [Armatimonadetes bacterium]|nr:ornithine carbamoyltransferase [Armatimonadota bacterium]